MSFIRVILAWSVSGNDSKRVIPNGSFTISIGTSGLELGLNTSEMTLDKTFVEEVVRLQMEWTSKWHESMSLLSMDNPWNQIEQNHQMNFNLWHEEDRARRDDVSFEWVRDAKREIDKYNQARNDAVEKIDAFIFLQFPPMNPTAPLHSETPGMMIDRLSIMALKFYHMWIEASRMSATKEHRIECVRRCEVLRGQSHDLKCCLESLLDECQKGTRRFKLYQQLKMYNDPAFTSQIHQW